MANQAEQAAMAQPPGLAPTDDTAAGLYFLQAVRSRLVSVPAVHEEFYALVTDYGKGVRNHVPDIVARVKELFEGHPDLIVGFNVFLPAKYRIEISEEDHRATAVRRYKRADEAYELLRRLRETGAVRHEFLEMLVTMDSDPQMDACEIYQRAKVVFGSVRKELLDDFAKFLPTECNPSNEKEEPREQRQTEKCKYSSDSSTGSINMAKKLRADVAAEKEIADREQRNGPCNPSKQAEDDNKRFRVARCFETDYGQLVATMRRVEKLIREGAHCGSDPEDYGARIMEFFPGHECQNFLARLYGERWRDIQKSLSENTESALQVVLKRLKEVEKKFVVDAMARRDPDRAFQRLQMLLGRRTEKTAIPKSSQPRRKCN